MPELVISVGSLAVAGLALWRAEQAKVVASRRARTGLYLTLKDRFFDVYKDLEPIYALPHMPEEPSERLKLFRYWHNAFDEWYATVKLGEKLEMQLWHEYFGDQVVAGLQHGALREAFLEVTKDRTELGPQGEEFRAVVEGLWSRSHIGSGRCSGIGCHEHEVVGRGPAA